MSLKRYAAKRDENEPEIVKTLRAYGCVVWQVSGAGLPDLLVLHKGKKWLADVKMPGKPVTGSQEKAWDEAATKAQCAVFILRTPEDAVAMLKGGLMPWEPAHCQNQPPRSAESRKHLAQIRRSVEATLETLTPLQNGGHLRSPPRSGAKAGRKDYVEFVPPRSTPVDPAKPMGMGHALVDQDPQWLKDQVAKAVDAAKEAEATFAPADDGHKPCAEPGCQMRVKGTDTCMAHDDGAWGLCGVADCGRLPVRDGLCEEHQ